MYFASTSLCDCRIAPSFGHWAFLADWQRAFPEAVSWAAPGLRDRAQVKNSSVRFEHDLGEATPIEWGAGIDIGLVPGAADFHEVYFFHRPTGTLILTDAIQNMEPDKLPAITRTAVRLSGGTKATTPRYLRAVLRGRKAEASAAVRNMLALDPKRVIFAHGRWFDTDGAQQLAHAFNWLVDE